jgi:hypothetical protein
MGFDFYAQQDLKGKDETIALVLFQLTGPNGKHPVLDVVYAGGDNDGWQNATLFDSDELEGLFGVRGVELDAIATERRNAELSRRLRLRIARHSARNLRDAVRDDGTPADATDLEDFLLRIPEFVVRWILVQITNALRFQNLPPARPAAEIAGK